MSEEPLLDFTNTPCPDCESLELGEAHHVTPEIDDGFSIACACCGFEIAGRSASVVRSAISTLARWKMPDRDWEPTKLRPCPFCGGDAERIDVPDEDEENAGGSCIQCKQCAASSALHFDRKENLYSSWNERAKQTEKAG